MLSAVYISLFGLFSYKKMQEIEKELGIFSSCLYVKLPISRDFIPHNPYNRYYQYC